MGSYHDDHASHSFVTASLTTGAHVNAFIRRMEASVYCAAYSHFSSETSIRTGLRHEIYRGFTDSSHPALSMRTSVPEQFFQAGFTNVSEVCDCVKQEVICIVLLILLAPFLRPIVARETCDFKLATESTSS